MTVGGNKLDIYNTAEKILASINQVFNEYSEVLPARQFIYVGEMPPHECEQVTVGFLEHYAGPPGAQAQEPSKCNEVRTAAFTIELVRSCAPGLTNTTSESSGRRTSTHPQIPSPATYNGYARQRLIDATLLMEGGMRVVGQESWSLGGLADVQTGASSGGYQAMILNIFIVVE